MKQLQPEIKQKEEEYDELDQIAHDVSSILSLPPRGPPFVIPNKDNGLRACLICGLLKTPEKVHLTLYSGIATKTVRIVVLGLQNKSIRALPTNIRSTFYLHLELYQL